MISPPAFLARRFVAGETAEDAIAVGRRLHARGIKATFDLLGEDVLDREAARRSAEANKHLLRLIPPEVERNVSIKLSMMGLDIAEDFCLELTAGILDTARAVGGFVRIDMEGSKHTQRTVDVFHDVANKTAIQSGANTPRMCSAIQPVAAIKSSAPSRDIHSRAVDRASLVGRPW